MDDVIYTEKRPIVKNPVNKFSFTDIKFYIDACFQKYSKWEDEEECRFVLISDFFEDDYFTIRTPFSKVFDGVSSSQDIIQYSNRNDILIIKIKITIKTTSLYPHKLNQKVKLRFNFCISQVLVLNKLFKHIEYAFKNLQHFPSSQIKFIIELYLIFFKYKIKHRGNN